MVLFTRSPLCSCRTINWSAERRYVDLNIVILQDVCLH